MNNEESMLAEGNNWNSALFNFSAPNTNTLEKQ